MLLPTKTHFLAARNPFWLPLRSAHIAFAFFLMYMVSGGLLSAAPTFTNNSGKINPAKITNKGQYMLTGTILDENAAPIPGVNILVKNTTTGTITDMNGKFSISVPDSSAILVVSFIGYQTEEILLNGRTDLSISLNPDIATLSEVVVVGYGTQESKDVTGSVVRITERDFNAGPVTNPLQQINGRAAGVTINQVGSEPGQAPSIRIRGITSLIGGNDPLVVVDGIQGDLSLLNQIPPSEILTIDILKDASATAIYGSRGAAGVVLVTTKQGKSGKTTIEYSGTAAIETITNQYDMLDATEWRAEAARRGIAASADNGGNTDWFKQLTRMGNINTHNLALSGGSKGFNYRASGTAILQNGVVIGSGSQNFIGRLQASQKALNDRLTFSVNMNIGVKADQFNNNEVIQAAYTARPTDPVYKTGSSTEYFVDPNVFNFTNPYARAKEILDQATTNSIFGSGRIDYEIVDGLTASVFGSWRKTDRVSGQYQSPLTTLPDARAQRGIATRENKASDEKLFDAILNYKKRFGTDHSLDATVVYEHQYQVYDGFKAVGRGFINDFTTFNALQSSTLTSFQNGDISSYKNDRTLVSLLGRINYEFKDRYLATVAIRRDGSSVFGANNKWASFPSVSLGWRISQEAFMSNQRVFEDLKLRAGFGITGNQQGLGALNSVQLVRPDGSAFFGGTLIPNYAISQNANPNLRWETRQMYNAGLDFVFTNRRLSGSLDYYNGTTQDLLFDYTIPQPPFPFGTIKANVGEVRNTGLEAALRYNVVESDNLTVTLAGNFSYNTNKVLKLSGDINGLPLITDYVQWGSGGTTGTASTNNGISYLVEGQPIGSFYLFRHGGTDAQGNQIIDDLDNDNSVSSGNRENPDRYVAGSALPKYVYAFTPSVRFKRLDAGFVFRGSAGNKIYNARRSQLSSMSQLGQSNVVSSALTTNIDNITYASDLWLENGSFFRFDIFTLGYNFNTSKNKYIEGLRLSFTANNIFVITDYTGIDPEISTNGSYDRDKSQGFGIDYGIYPRTRSFAIGANFTLK